MNDDAAIDRPSFRRWKRFCATLWREWLEDDVSTVAGAVTFFGVLAVFPFLIFVVSLAGMFMDATMATTLTERLHSVAPDAVATILGERIRALAQGDSPALLTLSAAGAIWAASGGVTALMVALNTAFDIDEERSFIKRRVIALFTTAVGAILSLLAVLAGVAAPAVADLLPSPWDTLARWIGYGLSVVLMSVILAIIYWALPNARTPFRWITPGSLVAALLWLGASAAFSAYVRSFGRFDVTYGTLGGFIVLLLWMWISSQVVLLGAEINGVLARGGEPKRRSGTVEKRVGTRSSRYANER